MGTLDEILENDDALRDIFIEKLDEEQLIENGTRKLHNFKVTVKENEIIINILEKWKEQYNFDELAFKNFNFENFTRLLSLETVLSLVLESINIAIPKYLDDSNSCKKKL